MGREWLRNRAGVLAEPNFRRFYAGYVTSLLGSSMSTVAIAWAVLDSGSGATGLGYVFAAGVVPQVLVLPVAGATADRLGRRRVMLAADVLRCAAQGRSRSRCSRAGPRCGCSCCWPGSRAPARRSSPRPWTR